MLTLEGHSKVAMGPPSSLPAKEILNQTNGIQHGMAHEELYIKVIMKTSVSAHMKHTHAIKHQYLNMYNHNHTCSYMMHAIIMYDESVCVCVSVHVL